MKLELDHLVIAARTLEEGVAWCARVLHAAPGGGGPHPLMGTHNRVMSIASPVFERAYLEVIAIDPLATPPGRVRWFDLDDPQLRRDIEVQPRLIHWVARTDDIERAVATLKSRGLDAGRVVTASRAAPAGELRWRITWRGARSRSATGARFMWIPSAASSRPVACAWRRVTWTSSRAPSCGCERCGGACGMRFTTPPSWSTDMSTRGWRASRRQRDPCAP